jgi:hypothetical protein
MIDARDRIIQYPARYQLTEVSTGVYDLVPVTGTVTEAGTLVNRELLMAMQGFTANETVFGSGVITETNGDGDTKVTTFNLDGTISEVFTSGTLSIEKLTTFNIDGSITEELV